jgi:hypothetical protein
MPFNLLEVDREMLNHITLSLGGKKVDFQFPPMIKSDSKGFNFEEMDMMNIEPLAIFRGSRVREVQLDWSYIITGGEWDLDKVADTVKAIRGFFYLTATDVWQSRSGSGAVDVSVVVIKLKAYDIIGGGRSAGNQIATFRADAVNISHKPPLIRGRGSSVYPLRTDVSMKLKLWTTGKTLNTDVESADGNDNLIDLKGLMNPKELGGVGGAWY